LPATLGALAQALAAARPAMGSRWPQAGERRRALDAALGEGGALDPLGHVDSPDRVTNWLNDAPQPSAANAEIVLTSDDFEDLTLRQLRLLGSADLIAHEPGVAPAILDRARADAVRREIAKGAPAPAAEGLTITLRRSPAA
jgi:uroporphyrin-III C-methyltransferase/precorrin-2 dehydrogenase/sirohydrochlorin ferrochelatase